MNLSKSEKNVYDEVLKGKSNKEIAETLFVSEKTIKFHLTNIFQKCFVKSRLELISKGLNMNNNNLPISSEQKNEVDTNLKNSIVKINKDSVEFVSEQFKVKESIETLHNNMIEVSKQGFNHNNVNAACNCARAINETINTAINAAKFIGSVR